MSFLGGLPIPRYQTASCLLARGEGLGSRRRPNHPPNCVLCPPDHFLGDDETTGYLCVPVSSQVLASVLSPYHLKYLTSCIAQATCMIPTGPRSSSCNVYSRCEIACQVSSSKSAWTVRSLAMRCVYAGRARHPVHDQCSLRTLCRVEADDRRPPTMVEHRRGVILF